MSPELIAILTVGIGLCALIYQTSRSLRLDVRNDINQFRLEMDQLRQEMDQFRQEVRDDINQPPAGNGPAPAGNPYGPGSHHNRASSTD